MATNQMAIPDALFPPGVKGMGWIKSTMKVTHGSETRSFNSSADGLVQDCSNSSALAMELLQSCTEPLKWQGNFSFLNIRSTVYSNLKQGKSEGFDSSDRPSSLAQIWSKSLIFQPVWPWNLMDDLEKFYG